MFQGSPGSPGIPGIQGRMGSIGLTVGNHTSCIHIQDTCKHIAIIAHQYGGLSTQSVVCGEINQ